MGAATTIVNAKVFDGTKSQDWTSVRFAHGLVTKCSVASAAQTGDEVIDAAGGLSFPVSSTRTCTSFPAPSHNR